MTTSTPVDLSHFTPVSVKVGPSQAYTYKSSFALKEGDHVIVDFGSKGLQVGVVTHAHAQLDPQATFTYKWVVQKVDRTAYDQILAAEAVARGQVQTLRDVEDSEAAHASGEL